MSIEGIQGVIVTPNVQSSLSLSVSESGSGFGAFANLILDKVSQVNAHIEKSNDVMEQYILNKDVSVHDVMIAMGKAKSELQLMVEVRNKLLEAYQEVVRMQV